MKITFRENGPIILHSESELSVRRGGVEEKRSGPVTLCRCGQSSNKPFCDGAHRRTGFVAEAAELDVVPPAGFEPALPA
ncbi:MAG: CDGSH iron-sulfur domain-containing protein [Armatimonadetes bacterium]|nr:CDGSH iron-sulfur domain-containing protein [Armatimonadota bacterium]